MEERKKGQNNIMIIRLFALTLLRSRSRLSVTIFSPLRLAELTFTFIPAHPSFDVDSGVHASKCSAVSKNRRAFPFYPLRII